MTYRYWVDPETRDILRMSAGDNDPAVTPEGVEDIRSETEHELPGRILQDGSYEPIVVEPEPAPDPVAELLPYTQAILESIDEMFVTRTSIPLTTEEKDKFEGRLVELITRPPQPEPEPEE